MHAQLALMVIILMEIHARNAATGVLLVTILILFLDILGVQHMEEMILVQDVIGVIFLMLP
jgi:hypothetical protein